MEYSHNITDPMLLDAAARLLKAGPERLRKPVEPAPPSAELIDLGLPRLPQPAFPVGQVGDLPPCPDTIRGRAGRALAGIIRRALSWYTAEIQAFHEATIVAVDAQTQSQQADRQAMAVLAVHQNARALAAAEDRARLNEVLERLRSMEAAIESLRSEVRQASAAQPHFTAGIQRLETRLNTLMTLIGASAPPIGGGRSPL